MNASAGRRVNQTLALLQARRTQARDCRGDDCRNFDRTLAG